MECSVEIQKICEELDDYHTLWLASMQEATCILTELSRFDESVDTLIEIIEIQEFIRNCDYADNQLIYLSYMNEAKTRIELANKNVDSNNNCMISLKLSEKSREWHEDGLNYFEVTYQNQLHALSLLSLFEDYGFEIEMKEALKKLNNKIGKGLNLYNLQIDAELVEMGIEDVEKLDEILEKISQVKNELYPEENHYKQAIIFEGEILLKKAKFSDDKFDKICYLNQCIHYFNNHLDFNDNYYNAQSLFNIGYAKLQLSKLIQEEKNLSEAIPYFQDCAEYFEETPYQNNGYFYPLTLLYLSKTSKKLALIENKLHDKYNYIEEVLIYCLDKYEENHNKEKIIDCYFELGDLFFKIKNYEISYHYLKKCIDLVEIIRASIHDLNSKIKFFNKMNEIFKLMIEICHYLNKEEETLKYVELFKHRIFLDKIIEKQKYDFVKPISKELSHELDNIASKIELMLIKIKNCDKNEFKISSNYEKLSKLKNQEEYYLYKIKTEYPEYYDYYYNQVFDYKKLNLKNKTFIEYYYTNEFLLIFLIENEKFIVKRVDFKEYNLKKLINDFKEQLIEYDDVEKTENILNKLFNILIEPIHEDISNDNLIIIPYKGLHNIPFNCLKSNEDYYLIDKFTITIAQSGSSLKYIENNYVKPSEEEYLVIGNPTDDLEYAEKEAIEISKLFKTKPLLKEEATKENILKNIEGKNIIHFAGHGRFDTQNPINSSLKLDKGERLYINDLNNLELNSELIVLSACETGIVSVDDNDETEGFVKYLQIDGTKYIIASLWEGIDDAAYELFKIFYSTNGNYSKRLQLAQIELKKNNDLFYWGNFQIYGI